MKETLNASDFITHTEEASKIAPSKVIVVTRFHCPQCKKERPEPEHGRETVCECGLWMQRFGNALHVDTDAANAVSVIAEEKERDRRIKEFPELEERVRLLEKALADILAESYTARTLHPKTPLITEALERITTLCKPVFTAASSRS